MTKGLRVYNDHNDIESHSYGVDVEGVCALWRLHSFGSARGVYTVEDFLQDTHDAFIDYCREGKYDADFDIDDFDLERFESQPLETLDEFFGKGMGIDPTNVVQVVLNTTQKDSVTVMNTLVARHGWLSFTSPRPKNSAGDLHFYFTTMGNLINHMRKTLEPSKKTVKIEKVPNTSLKTKRGVARSRLL